MDMTLKELVSLNQLGAAFYESILKAANAVERRIKRTPTSNVFQDRAELWSGVIFKNILPADRKPQKWGGY